MSHFHAKLQAHLAARAPSWADDAATARYADDAGGVHHLTVVPRALTAADVVDAHLAALRAGARPALAYDGAATEVARRTARRLGVELVDVAALPAPVDAAPTEAAAILDEARIEPEPVVAPTATEPMLAVDVAFADAPTSVDVAVTIDAPAPALAEVAVEPALEPAAAEPILALPAPAEIAGLLPAHLDVDSPEADDAAVMVELLGAFETALLPELLDAPALAAPAMPELAVEAPTLPETPIAFAATQEVALDAPALPWALAEAPVMPELAVEALALLSAAVDAPALPDVAVDTPASMNTAPVETEATTAATAPTEPALPWAAAPLVDAPYVAAVEPADLAAMPWNAPPTVVAPDAHAELLPAAPRRAREDHPTLLPQWGLPWTPANGAPPPGGRPVSEALSKADPALWNQAKRVDALRDTLAKTGAPSFGAVKPAASGWLSRLQVERA